MFWIVQGKYQNQNKTRTIFRLDISDIILKSISIENLAQNSIIIMFNVLQPNKKGYENTIKSLLAIRGSLLRNTLHRIIQVYITLSRMSYEVVQILHHRRRLYIYIYAGAVARIFIPAML